MRKVILRGLLAHKLRLALTALAIVLGVTFISGTFVLTDTLNSTFSTLFSSVYSKIDFQVRGVAQFGATQLRWRTRAGCFEVRQTLGEPRRLRVYPNFAALARYAWLSGDRRLAQIGRWLPGVTNAVRGNKSFTADLYPLGFARCVRHLRSTPQFFADAAAGTLPSVSIVDPDFGAYSEENPQDIAVGESFSCAVVNAVMNGPAWESTLLLWIYDEHGGYYDHVQPPAAVAPDDVPARNWQLSQRWARDLLRVLLPKSFKSLENADDGPVTYQRYGFRVPAVIVSPYARPDFVLSEVLDHTSVLKLIEEKWNLPALTHRDAAAVSPLGALDLTAPPAFLKPPDLPAAKAGPFVPS